MLDQAVPRIIPKGLSVSGVFRPASQSPYGFFISSRIFKIVTGRRVSRGVDGNLRNPVECARHCVTTVSSENELTVSARALRSYFRSRCPTINGTSRNKINHTAKHTRESNARCLFVACLNADQSAIFLDPERSTSSLWLKGLKLFAAVIRQCLGIDSNPVMQS